MMIRSPIEWPPASAPPVLDRRRLVALLTGCVLVSFACATRFAPPDEPVTEAGLAEALEWLNDPESEVELLEDGLRADVWVYERVRVSPNYGVTLAQRRLTHAIAPEIIYRKMLTGPKPGIVIAYASIHSVSAWSWPAWSGVEIALTNVEPGAEPGPIVIRVRDEGAANRMSAAIDRLRRARLLANQPSPGSPPVALPGVIASEAGTLSAVAPVAAGPPEGASEVTNSSSAKPAAQAAPDPTMSVLDPATAVGSDAVAIVPVPGPSEPEVEAKPRRSRPRTGIWSPARSSSRSFRSGR